MSIISSLLNNLARGSRRDRVCSKFVENEFEKCDHIMELYTRYDARVRAEEVSFRSQVSANEQEMYSSIRLPQGRQSPALLWKIDRANRHSQGRLIASHLLGTL